MVMLAGYGSSPLRSGWTSRLGAGRQGIVCETFIELGDKACSSLRPHIGVHSIPGAKDKQ
jgi:hypothetical protein